MEVDVDHDVLDKARQGFKRIEEDQRSKGFELVWFIVDGFVLYWDKVRSWAVLRLTSGSGRYARCQTIPTGPEEPPENTPRDPSDICPSE